MTGIEPGTTAAVSGRLTRLGAALCAVLLAVSLLPVIAHSAHAQAAVTLTMRPADSRNTAIHGNDSAQRVHLSGQAPANATIDGARWVARTADGTQVHETWITQEPPLNGLGVVGVTPNDFVRVGSDGAISGQLTVPGIFGDPCPPPPGSIDPEPGCTDTGVREAVLELYIAGQPHPSNVVPVDYTRPRIERYEMLAQNRIRVVFTEPVRHPDVELPSDWVVTSPAAVVTAVVGAAGTDTRELVLAQNLDEDATPRIEYTNTDTAVPTRIPYVDRAGLRLIGAVGHGSKLSVDRIRPAVPTIESVDATTPRDGEIVGRNNAPSVRVTNLKPGHDVTVTAYRQGAQVAQVQQPTSTNAVDVQLPDLGADGDYAITAVATDLAGNRSDDPDLTGPARGDGNGSVLYALDRTAPQIVGATRVRGDSGSFETHKVEVLLSEAVTPAGNAGTWTVDGAAVTGVTGNGSVRTLATSEAVSPGAATVAWTPAGGSTYADRAGNELAADAVQLTQLPPLDLPTITSHLDTTFTTQRPVVIQGTGDITDAEGPVVAELFDRGGETVLATSEPVASNGAWSIAWNLRENQRHRLEVRLRDETTNVRSARVAVADIVHDSTKPVVDVTEPAGPMLPNPIGTPTEHRVGDTVTISWRATDAAPGDPVLSDHGDVATITMIRDDNVETVVKAAVTHQPGQLQSVTYDFSAADLGGRGLRDFTYRVAVTDLAGNVGSDVSGVVRLLGAPVGFTAVHTEMGVIEARFNDTLTGTQLPTDWRVDGAIVQAGQPQARPEGQTVIRLQTSIDDPNATPSVQFTPTLPAESRLRGQNDFQITTEAQTALDHIRPAVPDVESVNGTTPSGGEVIGNQGAPTVRVGNLTAGDTVEVRALLGGQLKASKQASANATAVDVTLPTLPSDGAYELVAVAIDPSGNRSTHDGKNGPGTSDGNGSVSYVLDRVAPAIDDASRVDGRNDQVVVTFSKDVTPAGDAGAWTVDGASVKAVEGSGRVRTLTTHTRIPGGEVAVAWQPTDGSTYRDAAGNVPTATSLALNPLPAIAAPTVTSHTTTLFTQSRDVVISGTNTSGRQVVAELFDRSGETVLATSEPTTGSWQIPFQLRRNERNRFEVRLRDVETDARSSRVTVADLVHDDTKPSVDVTAPTGPLLPNPVGTLTEYGVGDTLTITWTATDDAPGDPVLPDHGDVATITMTRKDGVETVVKANVEHQAGQQQSVTYTFTRQDLGGKGMQDFSFTVSVADLAGNVGSDTSGAVRLLGNRLGYAADYVKAGVIEARFDGQLVGVQAPTDWLVDGTPVVASAPQFSDGQTVVTLQAPLVSDPNATPTVQFAPLLPAEQRLRGTDDFQISLAPRTAVDRIAPTLKVTVPDTGTYVSNRRVTFTGTTDTSSRPNWIRAYRATREGLRTGAAIATTKAAADGSWTLPVTLDPNRINRIVVQAADPANNRSRTLPSSPYTAIHDGIAPVVTLLAPKRGATLGPASVIRWRTTDNNPDVVSLHYRVVNGSWQPIAHRVNDTGRYRWDVPSKLRGKSFQVRVSAFDKVSRVGRQRIGALRVDLDAPVLRRARTVAPRRVRLVFNEPVKGFRRGAFRVDNRRVKAVRGRGNTRVLVLHRDVSRVRPVVTYRGTRVTDAVGNVMPNRRIRADRAFIYPVRKLQATRVSSSTVRLNWRDPRNRPGHLAGYRIFRDGKRIASVSKSTYTFRDTRASGRSVYVVRAIDTNGRRSNPQRIVVRR